MSNSLQNKTVRPGSLNNYAYYYSNRRPPAMAQARPKAKAAAPRQGFKLGRGLKSLLLLALVAGALLGLPMLRSEGGPVSSSSASRATASLAAKQSKTPAVVAPAKVDACTGNAEAKFIKISIEQRRLWACEGGKTVHEAPTIAGLRGHAETETPLGSYKIYAKAANTRLTGQDSRGAWNYPVSYWMPFLDNQHGTYGFHDATWRPESEFGNISPDSDKASHGCVELPIASQKWLYEWAAVGTPLNVEA